MKQKQQPDIKQKISDYPRRRKRQLRQLRSVYEYRLRANPLWKWMFRIHCLNTFLETGEVAFEDALEAVMPDDIELDMDIVIAQWNVIYDYIVNGGENITNGSLDDKFPGNYLEDHDPEDLIDLPL